MYSLVNMKQVVLFVKNESNIDWLHCIHENLALIKGKCENHQEDF